MIRAFVSVLVLTFASAAFAGETCENLVLNCSATYQAQGGESFNVNVNSTFADENWDEPSLANCASTLYFPEVDKTIIRVNVKKDLQTGLFTTFAGAAQIIDGPNGRGSDRTDAAPATAPLGLVLKTTLTLKRAINMGDNIYGNTVYLTCEAAKTK